MREAFVLGTSALQTLDVLDVLERAGVPSTGVPLAIWPSYGRSCDYGKPSGAAERARAMPLGLPDETKPARIVHMVGKLMSRLQTR